MSNLQIIELLCTELEAAVRLVRELASQLAQMEALSDANRAALESLSTHYQSFLGRDEAPDGMDMDDDDIPL